MKKETHGRSLLFRSKLWRWTMKKGLFIHGLFFFPSIEGTCILWWMRKEPTRPIKEGLLVGSSVVVGLPSTLFTRPMPKVEPFHHHKPILSFLFANEPPVKSRWFLHRKQDRGRRRILFLFFHVFVFPFSSFMPHFMNCHMRTRGKNSRCCVPGTQKLGKKQLST